MTDPIKPDQVIEPDGTTYQRHGDGWVRVPPSYHHSTMPFAGLNAVVKDMQQRMNETPEEAMRRFQEDKARLMQNMRRK